MDIRIEERKFGFDDNANDLRKKMELLLSQ